MVERFILNESLVCIDRVNGALTYSSTIAKTAIVYSIEQNKVTACSC